MDGVDGCVTQAVVGLSADAEDERAADADLGSVDCGQVNDDAIVVGSKKGDRIGDLFGEALGGDRARRGCAGVVQAGVVGASDGAGLAAVLNKAADSQNAIRAEFFQVVFFGTVAGATGWDVGESGAADYLNGQIFGLLARYGQVGGLDRSPGKTIDEGQALDDGIAASAGLLGKRNG